jgi:hypothetical protein
VGLDPEVVGTVVGWAILVGLTAVGGTGVFLARVGRAVGAVVGWGVLLVAGAFDLGLNTKK